MIETTTLLVSEETEEVLSGVGVSVISDFFNLFTSVMSNLSLKGISLMSLFVFSIIIFVVFKFIVGKK